MTNTLKLIIGFSILLTTVSASLLWFDLHKPNEKPNSRPIAVLSWKKETVKRKHERQFFWNEIGEQTPLYDNDYIQTGNNAKATIAFSDQTKLELEENTLIILHLVDNIPHIEIIEGSLNSHHLAMKRGNVIFNLKKNRIYQPSGLLSLRKIKGVTELDVISGKVFLQEAKAPLITQDLNSYKQLSQLFMIKEASSVIVSKNGTLNPNTKAQVYLQFPQPNQIFSLFAQQQSLTFKWITTEPMDQFSLIISQDPYAKQIINKVDKLPASPYLLTLPAGKYYWHVVGQIKDTKHPSLTFFFEIKTATTIQIKTPPPGAYFKLPLAAPIKFNWTIAPSIKMSRVTLLDATQANKVLWQSKYSSLTLVSQILPRKFNKENTYFFYIEARSQTNEKIQSSRQKFTLSHQEQPPSPEATSGSHARNNKTNNQSLSEKSLLLLYPPNHFVHTHRKSQLKKLYFSWSQIDEAHAYIFQLTHRKSQQTVRKVLRQTNTEIPIHTPGIYQWHVIALNQQKKHLAKSKSWEVAVKNFKPLPAPILLPPLQ